MRMCEFRGFCYETQMAAVKKIYKITSFNGSFSGVFHPEHQGLKNILEPGCPARQTVFSVS
jgi:hypothetical protein